MSSVLPHTPPFTLNSISPALLRPHSYRACTSGSRVLPESGNVWLDSSWMLRWPRALPRSPAGRASREVAKPWLLPRETFPEPQLLVPPVGSGQQPQHFHSGGEPISNGSCDWVLFFLFFFFFSQQPPPPPLFRTLERLKRQTQRCCSSQTRALLGFHHPHSVANPSAYAAFTGLGAAHMCSRLSCTGLDTSCPHPSLACLLAHTCPFQR